MKDTRTFWDKTARKYAASKIANQDSYAQTLERTKSYLTASDRVLEIGAGTGRTALALAPTVDQVVATDISDEMLSYGRADAAEQGIENVAFEARDAINPPKGPFDVVLAHNILHLVPDLDATLWAAHGALKPGGLLISKTFVDPESGLNLMIRFMMLILPVMQFFGKAPFVNITNLDTLIEAHRQVGFEIVENETYAKDSRRYLVARKL